MVSHLRITERDCRLLADIALAGGALDSRTIRERHFPEDRSGEACLRRLRLLRQHELLLAVRATVTFGPASVGRLPLVVGLSPKGADLIFEVTGERPAASSATLSSHHLEHRLGIGRLRLLLHDACRLEGLPNPQWIGEYDPEPGSSPGPNAKLSQRFRLCHQYQGEREPLTCWPDGASLLAVDRGGARHHLLVLWEFDRSTERFAQIKAKLPAYDQMFRAGDHLKLFPNILNPITRIFFVVPSDDRRRNIADAIRNVPRRDIVRLGRVGDITPQSFFRAKIWFTHEGVAREIIPSDKPS